MWSAHLGVFTEMVLEQLGVFARYTAVVAVCAFSPGIGARFCGRPLSLVLLQSVDAMKVACCFLFWAAYVPGFGPF